MTPYAPRVNVVSKAIRPNYAAIIGDLIRSLAEEQGMEEGEYREYIRTKDGERVFLFCCAWYHIPVFTCHYQKRGNE